jgi:L-lactate dehydrogenase (cytochrome)
MPRSPATCLNIDDLRDVAARKMPSPIFSYLAGGADDERTLNRNRAIFSDYHLRPRMMRDVSGIDTSAVVLGQQLAWPWITAPTGMPTLFHPEGEIAIARATAAIGGLYCLSTMASYSIEEIAAAVPGPKLFQLYLFKDRGISRELITRARAAGYVGLMLTVDIPVPANRERDKRTGMVIPPRFTTRSLLDFARRPGWCWRTLRHRTSLANFAGNRSSPGTTLLEFINSQFDPALSWRDLEWVAAQWGGPLAVKGILRPDDAVRAIDCGASAVILSNHGGRQLDTAATPLEVLEPVVEALAGRGEVILDGGIRRGTDMLKAIALGASAGMAGRPGLFGLAAFGPAGVDRAFQLLRAEFERGMQMLGADSIAGIDRSCVGLSGAPGEAAGA